MNFLKYLFGKHKKTLPYNKRHRTNIKTELMGMITYMENRHRDMLHEHKVEIENLKEEMKKLREQIDKSKKDTTIIDKKIDARIDNLKVELNKDLIDKELLF